MEKTETKTAPETRPAPRLKSISIRKAGPVRLTSVAQPLYSSCYV